LKVCFELSFIQKRVEIKRGEVSGEENSWRLEIDVE